MPVNPTKFRLCKWEDLIVAAAEPLSNAILGLISVGLLKHRFQEKTKCFSHS
jgi:hypothetical protein